MKTKLLFSLFGIILTINTFAQNPGGVSGANLWLKADAGVTESSGSLTGWTDQTNTNTFTVHGTPGYATGGVNFNPSVSFDNDEGVNSLPGDYLAGNTNITYVDGYAVYRKTNADCGALIGSSAPAAYGSQIFGGFSGDDVWVGYGSNLAYYHYNDSKLASGSPAAIVEFNVGGTASSRLNSAAAAITSGSASFQSIPFTPWIGGTKNVGGTDASSGWKHFRGEVVEMILFPSTLSASDKPKIESYLAVKYGITLDPSVTNYVSSAGTPVWTTTTPIDYWHDVFGIGKDDGSGLNQIQSNSINTGGGDGTGQSGKGNIVLSNASSLENNDFLLIGHTNGSVSFGNSSDKHSASILSRVQREWKVKHTGNVGTVNITYDLTGISNPTSDFNRCLMLIDLDGNGDFTNGTIAVAYASNKDNDKIYFENVTLPEGSVFTFAVGSLLYRSKTSGNWNSASNWEFSRDNVNWIDAPSIPDHLSNKITIMPGHHITVSSIQNANIVDVNASGQFTIASGQTFTTNHLNLLSDATNSASFINQGNFSGTISYQSYLSEAGKWHVIASPVEGQNIWSFATLAGNSIAEKTPQRAVTEYVESSDNWNTGYPSGDTKGNFTPGTGYSVLRTAPGIVTYTGTLKNTDVSVTIDSTKYGWNALGNPYPSAINANTTADATNNLISSNLSLLTPSYAALYLWDAASGAYFTISNTGYTPPSGTPLSQDYIQAGQGFFVKSKPGGGTFSITKAMQTHQTGTPLKSAETPWPAIQVQVNGMGKSSTVIAFNDNMTNGLDVSYDAGMLKADKNFALYSRLVNDNGVDFAIQALPETYDKLVIPLGLDVPAGTEITFSAVAVNLPAGASVYLEDRAAKTITQLDVTGAEYKVTVTEGTKGTGNFFVHTSAATTAVNELENKLQVYTRDRAIYINGNLNSNDVVAVYGVDGKLYYRKNAGKTGVIRIDASKMPAGIYIISIDRQAGKVTRKVVISE